MLKNDMLFTQIYVFIVYRVATLLDVQKDLLSERRILNKCFITILVSNLNIELLNKDIYIYQLVAQQ